LKVYSDLTDAIDHCVVVLLGLLDMSAAFDTAGYAILLERLTSTHGIDSMAHKWIRFYLSDRSQTVVVNDVQSVPQQLKRGVLQGSVLGPMLFMLYTTEIQEIVRTSNLESHAYADDLQLYSYAHIADMSE